MKLIVVLISAALLNAQGQSSGSSGSSGSGTSQGGSTQGGAGQKGSGTQGGTSGGRTEQDRSSPAQNPTNQFSAQTNAFGSENTFSSQTNSTNEAVGGVGGIGGAVSGAGSTATNQVRRYHFPTNSQGGTDPSVNRGVGAGASTNRYRLPQLPPLPRGTNSNFDGQGGPGSSGGVNTGSGANQTNTPDNRQSP
jgi:hypothetical protein